MPDALELRDFIYLDVERVRSLVAQNQGGLLSERTHETEHDMGTSAGGEGGVPFLAKVQGEVNYHYLRSQSETRSLHDYLFSEFYSMLESAG